VEHKIRIDIGDFHLETEGSEDAINKRVEAFKELVKIAMGAQGAAHQAKVKAAAKPTTTKPDAEDGATRTPEDGTLLKLYGKDGDAVTLMQGVNSATDAFLLLLLGYKMNGIDPVPVSDLLASLRHAGLGTNRIDTITKQVPKECYTKLGTRRAGKFRLTQPGIQKAQRLAQALVAQMV
jgi:hypothetical protein